MSARLRAILTGLGLCLPACLDLGGSWDPTAATSATTTSESTVGASTTAGSTTDAGTGTGTMTGGDTSSTGTSACEEATGGVGDDCDIYAPDCCEGQKCNPWGQPNGTKCFPVDPAPNSLGEPCEIDDDSGSWLDSCALGTVCWSLVYGQRACFLTCQGSDYDCTADPRSCCPEGFHCRVDSGGVVPICYQDCDPLGGGCPNEKNCVRVNGYHFECIPTAPGAAAGEPCDSLFSCDLGTFCGEPDTYACGDADFGCCIPYCDVRAPDCGAGFVCESLWDIEPPPGYEHLGRCTTQAP